MNSVRFAHGNVRFLDKYAAPEEEETNEERDSLSDPRKRLQRDSAFILLTSCIFVAMGFFIDNPLLWLSAFFVTILIDVLWVLRSKQTHSVNTDQLNWLRNNQKFLGASATLIALFCTINYGYSLNRPSADAALRFYLNDAPRPDSNSILYSESSSAPRPDIKATSDSTLLSASATPYADSGHALVWVFMTLWFCVVARNTYCDFKVSQNLYFGPDAAYTGPTSKAPGYSAVKLSRAFIGGPMTGYMGPDELLAKEYRSIIEPLHSHFQNELGIETHSAHILEGWGAIPRTPEAASLSASSRLHAGKCLCVFLFWDENSKGTLVELGQAIASKGNAILVVDMTANHSVSDSFYISGYLGKSGDNGTRVKVLEVAPLTPPDEITQAIRRELYQLNWITSPSK